MDLFCNRLNGNPEIMSQLKDDIIQISKRDQTKKQKVEQEGSNWDFKKAY